MNKKICFLFCVLSLFVIFAGGCQTTGKDAAKNAWQSILRADDWVHRNLW